MASYDGDLLIARVTGRIRYIDSLGVKFAMMLAAVSSDKRQNGLATVVKAEARELLERWSAVYPSEDVMGSGTVTQTGVYDDCELARRSSRSSHLCFVGRTANGEAMRVAWFDHGTIPRCRRQAPPVQQAGSGL